MATANFTADGQQKTLEQLMCSAGLNDGLHGQLTFLTVLNSFLSIAAFLWNAMILVALHNESSLHPPSKLLLRSLATTDLCVGLTVEPLGVIRWMSVVNEHWSICLYVQTADFVTGYIFCGVSVLTLTTISVDRLLALLLGLRYKQVVSLKRTYAIIITIWFVSAVTSTMYFWNRAITFWYGNMGIVLCLFISIFSYTKIFLILRQHQNHVQDLVQQPNQTNQLNIARYKKAVFTAIWLQLTLVACCLPYCVVTALVTSGTLSAPVYQGWNYSFTLVCLNSSLNPILYCWKIKEVRQAVKDTIRQMFCNCFPT